MTIVARVGPSDAFWENIGAHNPLFWVAVKGELRYRVRVW